MAKAKKNEPVVQEKKEGIKKTYELMVILESGVADKKRSDTLDMIRNLITSNGGSIVFEDLTWGERLLMYPINKQDYGFYAVIGMEIGNQSIDEFNEVFRVDPSVLRHLITETPEDYKFVKYAEIKEHYDIFPVKEEPKPAFVPRKRTERPAPAKVEKKEEVKKKEIKDKNLDDVLSNDSL